MQNLFNEKLKDLTFVAFDTETSGAYPVGFDVVEFGAVKWQDGKIIDQLQFLFKPREVMGDFIIGIHGITNEMVKDCPSMSAEIDKIYHFFKGAIPVAHHAPFDMGFIGFEFEKANLPFLSEPVLCSSLLSRKWISGVKNHKLQTLVQYLQMDGGSAHRALDDAQSCLSVFLACCEKIGWDRPLSDAIQSQGKNLNWIDYQLLGSQESKIQLLVRACIEKLTVNIRYKGSQDQRQIRPIGIVRNPDGDFIEAFCLRDHQNKRFYINRIDQISLSSLGLR